MTGRTTNGFFSSTVTVTPDGAVGGGLRLPGEVTKPGRTILLLDPRPRHGREDRRHEMSPAFPRGRARSAVALAASSPRSWRRRPARARPATREYSIAAVAVTWRRPERARRDRLRGFLPSDTTFDTVVYRRFTKTGARMIPNEVGDRGIQGPLIRADVGDTISSTSRTSTRFNRPHCTSTASTTARSTARTSRFGPGANVKPSLTYRLVAGPGWPASGRTTTTRRRWTTRSPAGCTARFDPRRARAATAERRLLRVAARVHDDQRSGVRRQHAVFRRRSATCPVGRSRWDDHHTFHVHGHR